MPDCAEEYSLGLAEYQLWSVFQSIDNAIIAVSPAQAGQMLGNSLPSSSQPINLPLGNKTMTITPCENAYSLTLTNDKGDTVKAGSILAEPKMFMGGTWYNLRAMINCAYDDERIVYTYSLLDPDAIPTVVQRPDGRLYCTECHCWVPNTANYEMRKEGAYAHSHVCGIRSDGEIYEDVAG